MKRYKTLCFLLAYVDKSPGLDGYSALFFRVAWDIVKSDFVAAVNFFFESSFMPRGINSTIITVVSKRKNINALADFRPISCCNVVYKCISKFLANRLQTILPVIISGSQSAFVCGRSISDSIFLSQELVQGYGRSIITSRCALKIDLQKAFDTVNWGFVKAMNFSISFVV